MFVAANWDRYSKKGLIRAVLDPEDEAGYKNCLIDRIHWDSLKSNLEDVQSVLDFGCGTGRFAQRIQQRGITYQGVDSSGGMIAAAQNYNPLMKNAFHLVDGQSLPFSNNTFDMCITVCVLQYFLKTENIKILSEIARVLKPNGKIVSIEQASLCEKSSGTVEQPISESDYIEKLKEFGNLISISRIRNCHFLYSTGLFLRFGRFIPFAALTGYLSWRERRAVANLSDEQLARSDYYDVIIKVLQNGD